MSEWAVVLGASSGTGAAIAAEVARRPGLDVFGVHRGRYAEQAEAVSREVTATGRRMVLRAADAATPEGAEAGADALLEVAGRRRVRLLVHALASGSVGHFLDAPEGGGGEGEGFHPRQVQKTFDVMAHSFVYWTQALARRDLLAPGARILALGNPLGDTLLHNTGLITAAKAALEIYVRHLAVELGPRGHRVNLLRFGTVLTPAVRHVYAQAALAQLEAEHARLIPAGRMCTVEEVARFVPLLLRDEADWFNGATIDFTGGMNLRLLDRVLNP